MIFGIKNNLGPLKVEKVENGLQILDFTTVAHYINYGGR